MASSRANFTFIVVILELVLRSPLLRRWLYAPEEGLERIGEYVIDHNIPYIEVKEQFDQSA